MDLKVLQEIGLSQNEAKVYETLLLSGKTSVNSLSVESNVHRRNVYDSIDKLVKKGLAAQEFVSGVMFVRPINPSRLLDILREKEARINSIMPELQKKFSGKMQNEEAVIYRGIEGVKNYLNDILEVNETFYSWGAKGFWMDERLKYFIPKFDRQRIKQGIRFRHIFDHEVKANAGEILKLRMNEYKFLPPECSSLMSIDFFGDHVVMFYGLGPGKLSDDQVQFSIVSQKIADGYRKYFDFMWEHLGKAARVD